MNPNRPDTPKPDRELFFVPTNSGQTILFEAKYFPESQGFSLFKPWEGGQLSLSKLLHAFSYGRKIPGVADLDLPTLPLQMDLSEALQSLQAATLDQPSDSSSIVDIPTTLNSDDPLFFEQFQVILYKMFWGSRLENVPTQIITDNPLAVELNNANLTMADIEKFRQDTSPTAVQTVVPLFGDFTQGPGSIHTVATLFRKRNGSVAPGQWSFPGGHQLFPGDLAAFRELDEEVALLHPSSDETIIYPQTTSLRIPAIVDQVVVDAQNGLKRYLNSLVIASLVYIHPQALWHSHNGSVEEFIKRDFRTKETPGRNNWQPFIIHKGSEFKGDQYTEAEFVGLPPEVKENLSPIARLAFPMVEEMMAPTRQCLTSRPCR